MGASAPVKYHYSQRYFTYSISWKRGSAPLSSFKVLRRRSKWKTLSGGEFGWGGTSVKRLTLRSLRACWTGRLVGELPGVTNQSLLSGGLFEDRRPRQCAPNCGEALRATFATKPVWANQPVAASYQRVG